jgi:hypothetical protein
MDMWSKTGYLHGKVPRESVSLLSKIEEKLVTTGNRNKSVNNSLNM